MNDRFWLHSLHALLQASGGKGPRYILRLGSRRSLQQSLRLIRKLKHSLPRLALLRPIPLINGFSCPVRYPAELQSLSRILTIEADKQAASVHAIADYSPSYSADPYPLVSANPWIPWGVREIQAPLAWNRSMGRAVRIAVIDTGIDYTHPDLKNSAAGGINLVYRHLPPMDDNGHGTHIAGTIAAASRSSGLVGVAPQADIHAVKAFDVNGSAYVSDIVQGIEWSIRNRMHIINMSFGMKAPSRALEDAIRAAYRAGTIVVASSGNEGQADKTDYPARFRHTISVGATGKNKKIAPFSNRGRQVDIYAPGQKIVSTWLNGSYHELSGTSMATSHVTGVIALMLAVRPNLTPRLIKEALRSGATFLGSRKPSSPVEVNALSSVKYALNIDKGST